MKTCSRCKEEKLETEFAYKERAKGWLQPYCKPCQKAYQAEYYRRPELYKANLLRAKKRNEINEKLHNEIIRKAKDVPCMDCGKHYPSYVMDFDHREAKEKLFGLGGAARRHSLESILKEMAKCDVVCANCHRQRTHNRSIGTRTQKV